MGENILTAGIDLLSLPRNTILNIGPDVVLKVTGLRNPCAQLNNLQSGLMKVVLDQDAEGNLIRKAGIMAIVEKGGQVNAGDQVSVEFPKEPHQALDWV